MKKVLFLLMTALLCFSCHPDQTKLFNETLKCDYDEFMSTRDSSKCEFYEADIDFDQPISTGEAKPVRWEEVFQEKNFAHIMYQPEGEEIVKGGMWVGDYRINPYDLKFTIEEAVMILLKTEPKFETSKCVLRHPLDGRTVNPLYIFGTHRSGFLAVDAVTGDVFPIE